MVEPPTESDYDQLADFTHRPFQPFLEPHFTPKGITLGPHDPKKLAGLLGKVAAKSKGGKGRPVIKSRPTPTHGKR